MRPYSGLDTSSTYESLSFRKAAGLTLRPGGTDLTDRALACCGFGVGSRLLDVGCGMGASVEHLRSRHGLAAAGIDPSQAFINEGLVRNPALPLTVGRAEALPVAVGEMDGILCECVLSLVDDPSRVLCEFGRALRRPGGILILSDLYLRSPAGEEHVTDLPDRSAPHGVMTRDTLEALLEDCGFALWLWEDHTRQLQELAARMLLINGSLDGLGCAPYSAGCSGERPGYYLLVARNVQ